MTDDELLALCTAATREIAEHGERHIGRPAYAVYVAAFSPDVVAGLIRRATEAEKQWGSAARSREQAWKDIDNLRARLAAVEKERDDWQERWDKAQIETGEWFNKTCALIVGIRALADELGGRSKWQKQLLALLAPVEGTNEEGVSDV